MGGAAAASTAVNKDRRKGKSKVGKSGKIPGFSVSGLCLHSAVVFLLGRLLMLDEMRPGTAHRLCSIAFGAEEREGGGGGLEGDGEEVGRDVKGRAQLSHNALPSQETHSLQKTNEKEFLPRATVLIR